MHTAVKTMSLVKYAGEYWVTLSDVTDTREPKGYSNYASVKSAVRTFVVRNDPDKYITFRGENQIKEIIKENKNNPLFNKEDFTGHTRAALIHWEVLDKIDNRFEVLSKFKEAYKEFKEEAKRYIADNPRKTEKPLTESVLDPETRFTMVQKLKREVQRLDQEKERINQNKERALQAIHALENLEITINTANSITNPSQ